MAGSIFFFPTLDPLKDFGAWGFLVGSFFYLVTTGLDLREAAFRPSVGQRHLILEWRNWVAAASYFLGMILYLAGSFLILSWVCLNTVGAWCFVFGSLLFVFGSGFNLSQWNGRSNWKYADWGYRAEVGFLCGSLLFAISSTLYLWIPAANGAEREPETIVASLFAAGSLFFLLGGIGKEVDFREEENRKPV